MSARLVARSAGRRRIKAPAAFPLILAVITAAIVHILAASAHAEDCNTNGVDDALDITGGTSQDCNTSGVPDECDIADGTNGDDNGNGVPEICETLFVDATATGANNGSSWTDAYNNLQDALAAADGAITQIWVADGTYMPDGGYIPPGGSFVPGSGDRTVSFILINGATLYGGFAGGETSLDQRTPATNETILSGDLDANDPVFSDNSYHVLSLTDGTNSHLDGFSVTAGRGVTGGPGGLQIGQASGITIRNCQFYSNQGINGGAIGASFISSIGLIDCTFINNTTSTDGGAMYSNVGCSWEVRTCTFIENSAPSGNGGVAFTNDSTLAVLNSNFLANSAAGHGGAIMLGGANGSSAIGNCIFSGNAANRGGACANLQGLTANCSFSGNHANDLGGALFFQEITSSNIANSILWGNTAGGNQEPSQIHVFSGNAPGVSYACIQDADPDDDSVYPGVGNIDDDPSFVDPDGDDLHVTSCSPCIDAGQNSSVPLDFLDLDGDGDTSEPTPLDLDDNSRFVDVTSIPDTGDGAPPLVDMGAYEISPAPAAIVYVDSEATGANDGTSWTDAFTKLQDALAQASDARCYVTDIQIWVADGTYRPDEDTQNPDGTGLRSATFTLLNRVALYGGFAGDETSLEQRDPELNTTILTGDLKGDDLPNFGNYGDNAFHVVTADDTVDPSAILDGVVVTAGNAQGQYGGGLLINEGEPTLLSVTFLKNEADLGGGIHSTGTISATGCTFDGNRALVQGGAVRITETGSKAFFTNCTFTGNEAVPGYSTPGGAIFASGVTTIVLSNCSFAGNTANGGTGGGAMYGDVVGTLTIDTSMFTGNGASQGGAMHLRNIGTLIVNECVFNANAAVQGGAIYSFDCGPAEFMDNTFSNNQAFGYASLAGAVFNGGNFMFPSFVRCEFVGNQTGGNGGAMSMGNGAVVNSVFRNNSAGAAGGAIQGGGDTATFVANCVFDANSAQRGGGYSSGGGVEALMNCTFTNNVASLNGGGIFGIDAVPAITGCILWENYAGEGGMGELGQITIANTAPIVNYCCIQGLTGELGGDGNIGANPLFLSPDDFDGNDDVPGTSDDGLRLQPLSPCIDAADNTAIPPDTQDLNTNGSVTEPTPVDFNGDPRFADDPLTDPDTGNSDPDNPSLDIVDMGAYEFQPADCNANGIADVCDVHCGTAFGDCDLPGCGQSIDCNSDNVPDECEPNCNTNDVADSCDITNGTSLDCNSNLVPDECDIADGDSDDCQPDGVPDECQEVGQVVSAWVGGIQCSTQPVRECWNTNANWCPDVVPDNAAGLQFDVSVADAGSVVTLNTSPTVTKLTLTGGAAVEVNTTSGANVRSLAVDQTIINSGVLRATDRKRLVLDAPTIDQTAGGILEASDGMGDAGLSILEINGSDVTGGTAQTIGEHSEIHLIGGATLIDVEVNGVVVPDGQTGVFSGTLENEGALVVGPDASQFTWFAAGDDGSVLSGNDNGTLDCVNLGGEITALLGSFTEAYENASGHQIDGAGIIFGDLTNNGVVNANTAGKRLTLFPPGAKQNNGTLMATNAATLAIEDSITGNGFLIMIGGFIIISDPEEEGPIVTADCIEVLPGSDSDLTIDNSTLSGIELLITGGRVFAQNSSELSIFALTTICPAGEGAVAELHILNSSFSTGELLICEGGVLEIASSVSLSDSFLNALTDENDWSWAADATLTMTGGNGLPDDDPTGYATLEVGGEDFGPEDGFVGNFSLPELIIGPDAHVTLVEEYDNGNRGGTGGTAEALYVGTLHFVDGAGRLNVNSLRVYYGTLIGDPSQIIDICLPEDSCAPGDIDGDGDVDPGDLALFAAVLLSNDTDPDHITRSDMNYDGSADGDDIGPFTEILPPP